MATTSRDVKLALSVEALGQENITKLEKQLRDLAATGGAGASEFADLADQIGRLGGQNDALQAVKALAAGIDELQTREEQAAVAAQTLATNLDVLKAATTDAKTAQDTARAALVAGEQAYVQAGNALRQLKTEYDAAGRKTTEYATELRRLVGEQNAARLALVDLKEANRQATAAVTEASAAQRKVESSYKSANAEYARATTALDAQSKALQVASGAAERLGVNTADLASAEASLVTTFANASAAAKTRKDAITEMAEADRLAAIEAKGMADMYARGAAALQAETLALRDAEKVTIAYAAAKAKAAADAAAWQREAEAIVNMKEAQQQAAKATEDMVARMHELQSVQAFEKQAAEAKKMLQSVEYVRFWEQALDSADRKQQELAANTKRVNDAFAQINVRPVEVVRQEIAATNAAMQTLAESGKLTGGALAVAMAQGKAKVTELEREMRQLSGTMTMTDRAAGLLKNSMGQIAAGNIVADAVGYLVNKVKELGREFIATTVETETLRRGLNAIYKDAKLAGDQFAFLNKTAQASGLAVGTLGATFVQFSAATRAANIPLAVSNDLFATVTRVAGSLGLSAEAAGGALNALGQMASKGVVSLEELRQQLGDRMPGALSAAAKGLGLTEAELIKLVESGSLAARDFFPAFSQGLKTLQGDAEGLLPTWNRLKNAFTATTQALGDAGAVEIMSGALRALAAVVGVVLVPIGALADLFLTAARAVGVFAGALATLSNPVEALRELLSGLADRQGRVAKAFGDVVFGADQAKVEIVNLTAATAAAATAAQQAGDKWAGLSRSQQASAVATAIASDAHKDLSARLVQTTAYIDGAIAAQAKETESLAKLAKAAQSHGEAMVALARLRGDEAGALEISARAAADHAKALAKVAESHAEETRLLELKRTELEKTRKAQGDSTGEIAKQTQEIDKKIQVSKAEEEQSRAAAEAARTEAVARGVAAQAYQDNSAKVEEYGKQLARTKEILELTIQLEKTGAVGKQEVKDATEAAAEAQAKYTDAIKDATENTRLETEARRTSLLIAKESLSSEVELLKAKAEQARNSGLLVTALDLERQAKAKQIEVERLLLEIKEIELKLLRDELQAKLDLVKLNEPENANKIKEIELRLELTKVQERQLESSRKLLDIKERETRRNKQLTHGIGGETTARGHATAATEKHSDALDKLNMRYVNSADYTEKQIALLEREAAAAEKAAEAYRKKWNIDKDGFTLNNQGQREQQFVWNRASIIDYLKQAGLPDVLAEDLAKQFTNADGTVNYEASDAQKKWGGKHSTLAEALGKMVDYYKFGEGKHEAAQRTAFLQGAAGGTATPTAPAPTNNTTGGAPTGQSAGKTVTVNFGGRSTSINTASDADANAMVGLLRQLETDSRRAS